MSSDGPDPVRLAEVSELHARVRRALGRLPARQAEAFSLRFFEGMTYREIADHVGVKRDLVGVLLHRAGSRLREFLISEDS